MRRIFVGDIQGCATQLDSLLRRLQLGANDVLYCVGDLVNRGPDSLGVLRRLRGLEARIVLGNHDLHLLRLAARGKRVPTAHPLAAVLRAPDRDLLLDWLQAQPVMRVEPDLAVVHGGLHPAWIDVAAIAPVLNAAVHDSVVRRVDRNVEFAVNVRYCDADGRRPPSDEPPPAPPFFPWDQFYRGTRTVVFGHWARRGLVRQPRLRGLDTGCVYGGALSAWIAEEDQVVQVPGWSSGAA